MAWREHASRICKSIVVCKWLRVRSSENNELHGKYGWCFRSVADLWFRWLVTSYNLLPWRRITVSQPWWLIPHPTSHNPHPAAQRHHQGPRLPDSQSPGSMRHAPCALQPRTFVTGPGESRRQLPASHSSHSLRMQASRKSCPYLSPHVPYLHNSGRASISVFSVQCSRSRKNRQSMKYPNFVSRATQFRFRFTVSTGDTGEYIGA